MHNLYPAIKTYAKHQLAVDDTHTLYIEECGEPDGIPVLVVHSGPGAGCEHFHRRFFDPQVYRIILFDQRGCGKSTPHAELTNNTTQDLIEDIEKIRQHLGVGRWILFGGAWGATLSLLYAEKYPAWVSGLVLHNVFLGRKKEIDWFYQCGASLFFPDHWQDFISIIPEAERNNLINAYHKRLNGSDELTRMSAAKHWSQWQAQCSALQPHHQVIEHFADPYFATSLATIETSYFANHCFIEENQILDNIQQITDIPGFIIHGRYNMVCPLDNAWQLNQQWPASELLIVRDAGHASREPGIIGGLIYATKRIAKEQSSSA